MMADPIPEVDVEPPNPSSGSAVSLHLEVTAMRLPMRPYATAHSSIAGPSQPVTVDPLPSMIPSGTAG